MVDDDKPPLALAPLLFRFAGESARIQRLVISDEDFRDIVEDFLLAHKTLQHLRSQPVIDHAKVVDHVRPTSQLEQDARNYPGAFGERLT